MIYIYVLFFDVCLFFGYIMVKWLFLVFVVDEGYEEID